MIIDEEKNVFYWRVKMKKILILVDYKKTFYSSLRRKPKTLNLELISEYFKKKGWDIEIKEFWEVPFSDAYKGVPILYQSSQDKNLFYKSYIEDIILGLETLGAIPIPDFKYLRAHENKVFMEILRDIYLEDSSIKSLKFGVYEDLIKNLPNLRNKSVIKLAEGHGSTSVKLFKKDETTKGIRKMTKSDLKMDALGSKMELLKRKAKKLFKLKKERIVERESLNRRKFVVQNFIENLSGDFKVLIYFDKYFVLYRKTNYKDFRASGSGMFEFRKDLPNGLLDYANKIFARFEVPFISMDIGFNGKKFFLFEFQFVRFGTKAIEDAPFFWQKKGGRWAFVVGKTILEKEFVYSVDEFIKNNIY